MKSTVTSLLRLRTSTLLRDQLRAPHYLRQTFGSLPPRSLQLQQALACSRARFHTARANAAETQSQASEAEEEPARPLTDRGSAGDDVQRKAEIAARKAEEPSYQLFFTCAKCLERSGHRISKQGYHHGTVLVNCPGCKNKHLISDHLRIFSDRSITLEDIMREKGELLKKGVLGADGDVEFYTDTPGPTPETEVAKLQDR